MFENFETVRILPEMRERDASIEEEFGNIIRRYDEFCQKNNIHINHLALAAQFQISKKSETRFYCNKEWKRSLSNLMKIIDKENLSLLVIDLEPLGKEIYEDTREFGFIMDHIGTTVLAYGFSLGHCWLSDSFSKIIYIGDTDDGFAVKHGKETYTLYETTIKEIVPTNFTE